MKEFPFGFCIDIFSRVLQKAKRRVVRRGFQPFRFFDVIRLRNQNNDAHLFRVEVGQRLIEDELIGLN